jgi:hypothetical protein
MVFVEEGHQGGDHAEAALFSWDFASPFGWALACPVAAKPSMLPLRFFHFTARFAVTVL